MANLKKFAACPNLGGFCGAESLGIEMSQQNNAPHMSTYSTSIFIIGKKTIGRLLFCFRGRGFKETLCAFIVFRGQVGLWRFCSLQRLRVVASLIKTSWFWTPTDRGFALGFGFVRFYLAVGSNLMFAFATRRWILTKPLCLRP